MAELSEMRAARPGRWQNERHHDWRFAGVLLAFGMALLMLTAALPAQAASGSHSAHGSVWDNLSVAVNKSEVIRYNRPYGKLLVGNSDIADVVPLSNHSFYVFGKRIGTTNLVVYGTNHQVLGVVDLEVKHDLTGLKRRIAELSPDSRVEVRSLNDAIIVSGEVSSADEAKRIVSMAEAVAPKKVQNFITVKGSQQVMLAVRFAEIRRTAAKELGLSSFLAFEGGNGNIGGLLSGEGIDTLLTGIINPDIFSSLIGSVQVGDVFIDTLLEALEEKGLASTLAEPNLIAMSGEEAHFLAGGEFPIPVGTNSNGAELDIIIEFKEFGVSLAFRPLVMGDGVINLDVAPEVSSLDPQSGIKVDDIVIPGLQTRRTETTVALRHGQSFAIAGLLQKEFKDTVRQFPGLGDIPLLGALMRSSEFERGETELVIIITPYLVSPTDPSELAIPHDYFSPPSDFDLFLMGRTEGGRATGDPMTGTYARPASYVQNRVNATLGQGGLVGDFGYANSLTADAAPAALETQALQTRALVQPATGLGTAPITLTPVSAPDSEGSHTDDAATPPAAANNTSEEGDD